MVFSTNLHQMCTKEQDELGESPPVKFTFRIAATTLDNLAYACVYCNRFKGLVTVLTYILLYFSI